MVLAGLLLAACDGPQSALDPAGREAAGILTLFWVILAVSAVVWIAMMGATIYFVLRPPGDDPERDATRLIIGGGVIFPTVGLAIFLGFGLSMLPDWRESGARLTVKAQGEQWWWRFTYEDGDGEPVVGANELHLPAGEPVEFVLTANEVIHSFWIPAIGGKLDMIPGHTNRLRLTAERPGVYRGVCAEFCGPSHALMAFEVVVHERADFERWLAAQAVPAAAATVSAAPVDGAVARGRAAFLANGCGGCHRVAGLPVEGGVGPDLSHVGGRRTLAAATLANTPQLLAAFIADPGRYKPGVRMPAYRMLPEDEIAAMAAFLSALKEEGS